LKLPFSAVFFTILSLDLAEADLSIFVSGSKIKVAF
jgi:hypothetical protein